MGENIVERARQAVVGAILSMERDTRVSELTKDEERSIALATIAALREPSEAMIDSMPVYCRSNRDWRADAREGWQAMIDTFLTEGTER